MKDLILIENNYVSAVLPHSANAPASHEELATVLSNIAWYGYIPSKPLLGILSSYSSEELLDFWNRTKNIFNDFFKEGLNAENGVVYKNFPAEMLEKTFAEYWIAQIFMYIGLPSKIFAEPQKERATFEIDLKILTPLKPEMPTTLGDIFSSYKNKKVSLRPKEIEFIPFFIENLSLNEVNISEFAFKMNGITFAKAAYEKDLNIISSNATDVLRFAAILSGHGDNLNSRITHFKFMRKERKLLLSMLCGLTHYEEDIAARKESFKALFRALKPGDYKWAQSVSEMYNRLYHNKVSSFNSNIEKAKNTEDLFNLLRQRPGVFLRRFHEMYAIDAKKSVEQLSIVLCEMNVYQLLKIKKYIQNVNLHDFMIARPKASWNMAKILDNKKCKFSEDHILFLTNMINKTLSEMLNQRMPEGISLDPLLRDIKLPSSDQEISIGRGTKVRIAENITTLRSATYWTNHNQKMTGNFYFDNSWNFIHKNDENQDFAICWDTIPEDGSVHKKIALFSGDPSISGSETSEATQFIDINLEEAKKAGMKYAVWSVLSYNNIAFNEAEKAFGCLQFVDDENSGQLFEPSRAEVQLSLKTRSTNKFLVLVDIVNHEIVYLDMPFPRMSTQTANANKAKIRHFIPALFEQLNFIPSVYELGENINSGNIPFLLNDKDNPIKGKAYVFCERNEESEFEKIDLQTLLS